MTITMTAGDWLSLFMHYLSLSLLSVGGAITTAPDMHRFLVDSKGWLTDPQYSEVMSADAWKHEAKSMITADGKKHVFYRISDSAWEIYDLDADPEEKKNLSEAEDAKQLQADMAAWIEGPLSQGAPK